MLQEELDTNPFLRASSLAIRAHFGTMFRHLCARRALTCLITTGLANDVPDVDVFAALRKAKDTF